MGDFLCHSLSNDSLWLIQAHLDTFQQKRCSSNPWTKWKGELATGNGSVCMRTRSQAPHALTKIKFKKKKRILQVTTFSFFKFYFCDFCTDSLSAFFKLRKAGPLKEPQEPNTISNSSAHIVHKSKRWFRKIPGTKSLYHLRSEFVYQGHYLT